VTVDRWAYVVQSLAWSLLGVPVGFLLGLHVCWECRKRGVVMPFTHRAGRIGYGVLVVVVAALAIVSQVQNSQNAAANKATTDCLRIYSTGVADAIDASRKAAAEVSTAQDALWRTIAEGLKTSNPGIRSQLERQLDDYLKARDTAKQTQAVNPIKAPRDLCPE
jgi:hypothetical protein